MAEIGTDASPWGLGGWLAVDGRISHYCSCPLTDDDAAVFGIPSSTADGQQLWGCLAVLVAVDIWTNRWAQSRIVLRLEGTTSAH